MGVREQEGETTPGSTDPAREEAARRELFAVLAHELRSPIGAILGFEELLSEGIFGDLPAGAAEALVRIRSSARQLLDLVGGLSDLSLETIEIPAANEAIALAELVRTMIDTLDTEALGRDARLELQPTDPALPAIRTDRDRLARALQLAFMAAIKTTSGGTITVSLHREQGSTIIDIAQTRLDPSRDDPDVSLHATASAHLTGAGLRVAMARSSLAPLGGDLQLLPAGDTLTLRLLLPAAAD